jgi:nitrate/nitrite transporter NarK
MNLILSNWHKPYIWAMQKAKYLVIGVLINLCIGTVFSWSVFRKPLEALFSANATQSGIPFLLSLFFFAFSMPPAAKLVNKFGPKLVTFLGGTLVGAGWLLSSYAQSIDTIHYTYGVLVGIGVGFVYTVPITVAAKWYPNRKGFAIGICLSGFGFSAFFTAPLAVDLMNLFGIMSTFKILGIAFFTIIGLLALAIKLPHDEHHSVHNTESDLTSRELFKNPQFYALWICYTIGAFVGLMSVGISSPVGIENIGLTPKLAASYVALFAIANGLSRTLFGWLTDKFGTLITSIIAYCILIIGSVCILNATTGDVALFIIAFVCFWTGLGGWLSIAPSATATFFGNKHYNQNYGFVFTAYGVGAVLGTLSASYLRDTFGSYTLIFYPIIGLSIIGIIISIIFFRKD